MKKFQTITISHADNGIIVGVGCIHLVFEQSDLEKFYETLRAYLIDPDSETKKFFAECGIKMGLEPQPMPKISQEEKFETISGATRALYEGKLGASESERKR